MKVLKISGFLALVMILAASLTFAVGTKDDSSTTTTKAVTKAAETATSAALICAFKNCQPYCNPTQICRPNQVYGFGVVPCHMGPSGWDNNCGEPAPCCPNQG